MQKTTMLPEDYQFNLCDFAFFLSVMKNPKAYQNVLSIIMDEPDIEIKEVKVEQVILNKSGKRAIRLDLDTSHAPAHETSSFAVRHSPYMSSHEQACMYASIQQSVR